MDVVWYEALTLSEAGQTKRRPNPTACRPVRKVPILPELIELLRAHIETFGATGP